MSGYWIGAGLGMVVAVALAVGTMPGFFVSFALGVGLTFTFACLGHIALDRQ